MVYIRNYDCLLWGGSWLPSNSLGVAGGVRANGSFIGREFTGLSAVIMGSLKASWGDWEEMRIFPSNLDSRRCPNSLTNMPLQRFQFYRKTIDIPYPSLWISQLFIATEGDCDKCQSSNIFDYFTNMNTACYTPARVGLARGFRKVT